jgi:DGQHR domain-containing protein
VNARRSLKPPINRTELIEVAMNPNYELRIPALEILQGSNRILYCFAVDGKLLPSFATISRLRRTPESQLQGYQRPEVISHIAEIRRYLESSDPMIPNAVVVALNKTVRFQRTDSEPGNSHETRVGTLIIPLDPNLPEEDKPGWIVDGQQRIAAIRDAQIEKFPICVIGFITDDLHEQKNQFILVNSTKPLPKGLIYELLPSTEGFLPSFLQKRRFPAYLMERLNHDEDSPFKEIIMTASNPGGIVRDTSILKMCENSLHDGVLHRFRDATNGGWNAEDMLRVLKYFWSAVANVFKDAWGLPPRRSRLMHGAGIVSLGFIMDAIGDRSPLDSVPTEDFFKVDLDQLTPLCRWTHGYWNFAPDIQRKWNDIQNTPRDIQMLANYLLIQYKKFVW